MKWYKFVIANSRLGLVHWIWVVSVHIIVLFFVHNPTDRRSADILKRLADPAAWLVNINETRAKHLDLSNGQKITIELFFFVFPCLLCGDFIADLRKQIILASWYRVFCHIASEEGIFWSSWTKLYVCIYLYILVCNINHRDRYLIKRRHKWWVEDHIWLIKRS